MVNKKNVEREAKRILHGFKFQLTNPDLIQPGTLFKDQRNPSLLSYVATLQRKVETGPELANVIFLNSNKRN